MMKLSPLALVLLCAVTAFVFAALYGPLLIPLISSFFHTAHGEVQWHEPSFSAYQALADNQSVLTAVRNTLVVGFSSTLLALLLGTVLALHYCGGNSAARDVMHFTVFLPFLMPPIITGLSLLIFFRETDIPRSLLTVIMGHTLFVLALSYRMIVTRLRAMGTSLIEASTDLGASAGQTMVHIILPNLASTFIGAGLLSFALSFDETMITLLVTGTDNTLPIRLWAMMRLGFSPDINALVGIVLGLTMILCAIAVRMLLPSGAMESE
jgi:ABC-type spermidine/putrescine transport system permease subunit II